MALPPSQPQQSETAAHHMPILPSPRVMGDLGIDRDRSFSDERFQQALEALDQKWATRVQRAPPAVREMDPRRWGDREPGLFRRRVWISIRCLFFLAVAWTLSPLEVPPGDCPPRVKQFCHHLCHLCHQQAGKDSKKIQDFFLRYSVSATFGQA